MKNFQPFDHPSPSAIVQFLLPLFRKTNHLVTHIACLDSTHPVFGISKIDTDMSSSLTCDGER
jgi:hypothetical protein